MKKIKIVSGILSAVFIILTLIVFITQSYSDYRILIGSFNGGSLSVTLTVCSAICLFVSAIASILSKNEKHIIINSVLRFLCICIIGFSAFMLSTVVDDCNYYEFSSPDGKYTVIAQEWNYILAGGVVFLERQNPLIATYKGSVLIDDGCFAIKSGNCHVEWDVNVANFTLDNGNGNIDTVKIIM